MLLGLLREDKALTNRFLRSHASVESIRKQIERRTSIRDKVSSNVDLPLSNETKRVLAFAAEESERLSHQHIGTEHLLLGLLREEKSFAAEILHERGLELAAIREELVRIPHQRVQLPSPRLGGMLDKFSRNLTQAAMDNKLDPVIGRDQELEWVIEVLCSRHNKNPILIGERGAGKTAIVEGLAQRIADGNVPPFLTGKKILAIDVHLMMGSSGRQKHEEFVSAVFEELINNPQIIVFIDEFQALVGATSISGSRDAAEILRPALLGGEIQCIGACSADDYQKSVQATPWLGRCFRTVKVLPLDQAKTLLVLQGRKEQYEKFHSVSYTDEALQFAARCSSRYFPDSPLVAKAAEILDMAGSRVKLRQPVLPAEITEVLKRIKFIVHRMENAVATQDFEKARFYSDEERKERDNLRVLREKYRLDESSTGVVTREDIKEVVSRWTGVPITSMREDHAAGELNSDEPSAATTSSETPKRLALRVFLCHSSKDKPAVRDLYSRLKEKKLDPWLDEENLIPGQEWDYEISKAVHSSHVVIVCLSAHSVTKAGYLQREIREVLDVADEQPEGTIYVIPLKLEECEVPSRLRRWQWVNFFETNGFERLMYALLERSRSLGLGAE